MFAGTPLGAAQRLLPETIPMRFFGTAVVAHVLAWVGLVAVADDVPGFVGGPGPVLAVVHVATLGVLTLTAMGASLQMLPVALSRPAPSARASDVVFGFALAGASALVVGFALVDPTVIAGGTVGMGAAVAVYAVTLGRVLWGATSLGWVVAYAWVALGSLVAAAALAVGIAADYGAAFLPDRTAIAAIHAVLGGYGFMGFLALGFSHVLVPMFAMAEPTPPDAVRRGLAVAATGLALVVVGLGVGGPELVAAGAVVGIVAAGLHVRAMTGSLSTRMRRRLGPEFGFIRASWFGLAASLLLGGALCVDGAPDSLAGLFVFVLVFGWLLTLLVGVLQRTVPFLASMHAGRTTNRPVAPSALTAERPLAVHRWCHGLAVVGVAIGIAAELPAAIRAGAGVGAVGAIAFAVFAAHVALRARAEIAASANVEGRPRR